LARSPPRQPSAVMENCSPADLACRFQIDGMVMHANRSCKLFSIAQDDVRGELRDGLGLPVLILEADVCDVRLYNEGAVRERVAAFLEML